MGQGEVILHGATTGFRLQLGLNSSCHPRTIEKERMGATGRGDVILEPPAHQFGKHLEE